MSNIAKLALAALLAVAAGILNLVYLNRVKEKPAEYLKARARIEAGTVLEDSMLDKLAVPGKPEEVRKTLIPVENRSLLLGIRAARDIEANEMLLQQDLPTSSPRMDILGPFRLLSVGGELISPDSAGVRPTSDSNMITVAVKESDIAGNDGEGEKSRRLLQIVDAMRNQGNRRDSRLRFVAIQVYRNEGSVGVGAGSSGGEEEVVVGETGGGPGSTEPATGDADRLGLQLGEVAIIVPLENVRSIPGVLMVGRNIGFVVPAYRP